MTTAEKIQKYGFRRWYERALIESHAYLVTSILGLVVSLAGMELIIERGGAVQNLIGLGVAMLGALFTVFGLQRYAGIMILATRLNDQATCPQCGTYAALDLLAAGPKSDTSDKAEDSASIWLKVKCRKCGNPWTI